MTLYNRLTDRYGFVIPLVVQAGMVIASMLALASGILVGIGYVLLGIAAVLFAPRAFEKGILEKSYIRKSIYLFNWILLAFFSIYIGISFAVAGTLKLNELSSLEIPVITVESDVLLNEYEAQIERIEADQLLKKDEFDQSTREDTLANIQAEQNRLAEEKTRIQGLILDRKILIETGKAQIKEYRKLKRQIALMTSDDIFGAIIEAWTTGRKIQVIFWAALIVGIELMIINALTDPSKETEKPKQSDDDYKNRALQFFEYWPLNKGGTVPGRQFLEKNGYGPDIQARILKDLTKLNILTSVNKAPYANIGREDARELFRRSL